MLGQLFYYICYFNLSVSLYSYAIMGVSWLCEPEARHVLSALFRHLPNICITIFDNYFSMGYTMFRRKVRIVKFHLNWPNQGEGK